MENSMDDGLIGFEGRSTHSGPFILSGKFETLVRLLIPLFKYT